LAQEVQIGVDAWSRIEFLRMDVMRGQNPGGFGFAVQHVKMKVLNVEMAWGAYFG
jgi:hypothetical protein